MKVSLTFMQARRLNLGFITTYITNCFTDTQRRIMSKSSSKYYKDLKVLMKNNGFTLARSTKHLVWNNSDENVSISTSKTPRGVMAINQIRRDIRRKIGSVM